MVNRKGLLIFAIVVALLGLAAGPAAAAGGIRAKLSAARHELTVGDPVELTLEVTHPAGYQVIIPRLNQSWGNFEILDQSAVQTQSNADGTETTRQTITVTLYRPGAFETPPLAFSVADGSGQVSQESAAPVTLTVTPVLAEGDTTLKDIRPQATMSAPFPWPMLAGGLVAVAAVVGGGWWFFRRRRELRLDYRPPFQVALDELARITGLGLTEEGRFKEHYSLVTDVLRRYVEHQFAVNATDRTTTELKRDLAYTPLAPEHVRLFIDLFTDADLVKFANVRPELTEAQQFIAEARRFVELTRPQPQAADARPGNPHLDTHQRVEAAR